jgi:hypothetical protein
VTDLKQRCVPLAEAAAYVGLSKASYRAAVKRGVFPGPLAGTSRYDLKAIDRALDRLSGIEQVHPEQPEMTPLEKWRASREGRTEARPCG